MMSVDVRCFVDDDQGYELWLIRNRRGWVLNAYREPTSAYLVLHAAECSTISGRPAKGDSWTRDYAKVCCSDRLTLEGWAQEQVGVSPQRCTHCMAPA
jgi:hypothetical protein